MIKIFNKIKKFILNTLFPSLCLGCKKEGNFICDVCFNKIKIEKYPLCPVCNKRLIYLADKRVSKIRCASCKKKTNLHGLLIANLQDDVLLHQMIYAYKYDFIKELANPLAEILIRYFQNFCIYYGFEQLIKTKQIIFIPVPLHTKRLKWRGFNQSELLAKKLAENSQNEVLINVLSRCRNTIPQMEIKNKEERQKNIQNAFSLINPNMQSLIYKKTIILVDDICTTGSTLEECAKTLKPLKPKEIWALVLTKG